MTRALPIFLALLLSIAAIGAVACGDDGGGSGELTLEEYFQQLEGHASDFEDEGQAADDEFDFFAADSEEEQVELAVGFFTEAVSIYENFVDDLDGLNAPPEVASVHDDTVGAGRTAVEKLRELLGLVEDAETEADLNAALEEITPSDADFEAFSDGCFELQDIADESDIDVDLQCG